MPGRLTALALSLAAVAVADPAGAVLKHYSLSWTTISEFNTFNPNLIKFPPCERPTCLLLEGSRAIIDDTNNGNPVLRRLVLVQENHTTVGVGHANSMFLSRHFEEGPRKGLAFTGSGDTSTTIAWGLVTGWTITGGFWCGSDHSAVYCTYAGGKYMATVDPVLRSPFYDLGTWTFHGTGFTAVPFVHSLALPPSTAVGNAQYQLRGRLASGIVPALPVLGVTLLGASLLLAGARLSRKR